MLERIASNPLVASPPTRVIAAESGLWISVASDAGRVRVVPRGDVDRDAVSIFADCLDAVLAAGSSTLLVDLSGVSYLGVAGYREMVWFGERCRRRNVAIRWVAPSSAVRVLFRILGPPTGDTAAVPSSIASAS